MQVGPILYLHDHRVTVILVLVHDGQPRAWTHPCNCTLIAHESCLLQWIQTAQANPQRAKNALKCPQCGAKYEIESDRSRALDILGAGNRVLQRVGGKFTLVGAAGIMGVMGSGAFAFCSGGREGTYVFMGDRCVHHVHCIRCLGSPTVHRQRVGVPPIPASSALM